MAVLIVFASVCTSAPAVASTSPNFEVLSSNWASGEAGPGSTNAQLILVVSYTGPAAATGVQVQLQLPVGFTDTTGNNSPTDGDPDVAANSVFSLKYNLSVASSVAVGTYKVGLTFNSEVNNVPYFQSYTILVNLFGNVVLSYDPSQTTLTAGAVNAITFTLSNGGTGVATQIRPTVSTSSGSVLTVLTTISSLAAGASTQLVVDVFVPSSTVGGSTVTSTAGSAVILTFSSTYVNAYGTSTTASQAIGFHAVSEVEPIISIASSSGTLIPGQATNIPVVFTNLGPGNVTRVYTTITATSGFSVLSQIPTISSLDANRPFTAIVTVFAPASTAGTALTLTFSYSYIDPYGTSASGSQTLGFYTASTSSVSTGGVFTVSSSTRSLVAGEQTDVMFTIRNNGAQAVYSPSFLLTVPSPLVLSSSSSLSLSSASVPPGGSIEYNATISSASSSTGGSYSGSLTVTYADQSGNAYSQSTPITFDLVLQVRQVSASSLSTQVFVGNTTMVAFEISNTGNVPVYSPTFSLAMPSGLGVTSNSTYSRPGFALAPGQSMLYEAEVGSGPSTSQGTYTGTLTVAYTDAYGNSYSQSFSPGFVLVAGIELVVQDLSASPAGQGSITVTGTLLNEGLGSAYYLEVAGGSARGGQGASYIGEVDPNTPVPFSVSAPYQVGAGTSKVDLQITASYRNNYGQPLSFEYSAPVTLTVPATTASSGAGSQTSAAGSDSTGVLRYVIIAVILVAVVASALYVRRSRKSSRGSGAKPDVI